MKYTIPIGAFIACGSTLAGAGALNLAGSDSMASLANVVLAGDGSHDCGAATLTYTGNGSVVGESALVSGAQQIALMSRPLRAAVCSSCAFLGYRMNPVALDAGVVLVSRREGTAGLTGSAYTASPVVDPTLKTCLGVKFSGAPFERLRALFGGGDGSAATANGSATACTSSYRLSILKNWQNFTSSTCGHAGDPIRHAFRPDDASADSFKGIVGVTGFCNGAATGLPGGNQDNDPVRRPCAQDEQVCSPAGDLGVVLAISVPASGAYPGASSPPDTSADRVARWFATEFHRLHQSKTLAKDPITGTDITPCRRPGSDEQIGCLVAVSPYSTGYAALSASRVSGVTYLKIGNVQPTVKAIQLFGSAGAYPLTRRLFVNDLYGNAGVVGDEAKLLGCFMDRAYTDPGVITAGFVPLTDNPALPPPAGVVDQTCF